jgi:hypothetical protein
MKPNYKGVSIKTHTKEDKLAVYHLLHKFTECPITIYGIPQPNPHLSQMDMDFSVVYVSEYDEIASRYIKLGEHHFDYPKDISKIIEFFTNPPKVYEVEDVGSYTAKINNTGIVVGCQTITFEKFQEISDMVDEFKKEKP